MTRYLLLILFFFAQAANGQTIRVGAKHFNEGYIISEMISQLLEQHGFRVERVYNLGGTLICFEALRNNSIDVYPEYTGTIAQEILKSSSKIDSPAIARLLHERFKLTTSAPFGFTNSYGLVIRKSTADEKKLFTLSDLKDHPELSIGLSYEFLKRRDGWDNLSAAYDWEFKPTALEHGLAYDALRNSRIDVTDAYTTDGEISKYELTVLRDDKNFFPEYAALALYRDDFDPNAQAVIQKLTGKINEQEIQRLNAAALFEKRSFAEIARGFLIDKGLINNASPTPRGSIWLEILSKTGTHLMLTLVALVIAIAVAVPAGIVLYWNNAASKPILYIAGLLQTIPSIALLAVMIPLLGIGIYPALAALFLYALLPILRNTVTGLQSVDPLLKDISDGMGMTRTQKLRWIELPLAAPVILAGIRTASVINIGTATLAAFIGAGGLGEFIVAGLALNNTEMILQGAIPAALLAIIIELAFELIGRTMTPPHLRA
ncbi:MAG TPA: glycine betaine ABC transporter substrate-binding protein [Cyclobacteriaceae bacterium]|nr:glycine betaine ABC transporter substrate-binding protein [Cyclobacteriaceae bacterium]